MGTLFRALLPSVVLLTSCATPVAVISSSPSPTVRAATAAPTTSAPVATASQNAASNCGLLVVFAGGGGDPKYLLTLTSGNTTTQYRLSGAGTAPTDIGDLYATKTPQLLAISGRQVAANSAEPQAINLMDFTVTRVPGCPSSSTPSGTTSPAPNFGASECTTATATTREVIERYFALSTSNNTEAVTDCFAKAWRENNATGVNVNAFADGAALWSHSGPATDLVITFGDLVKGCDRFRVSAQMPPDSFWMKGQTGGHGFFSVGPEGGRMRIYEISTALATDSNTSLRCG